VHEYGYSIEKRLKTKLKRIYKKNKKLYDAVTKGVEEIIKNPYHYKPLRHDLKGLRRVHLEKSFVLVFEIDEKEKMVRFLDLDHHDEIYRKRY
jgi:YafQ family addiction module toxin component